LADLAWPLFSALAIAVPVLVIEENWHGRPMIDDPSDLWLLPAALVCGAFLCGGAMAAFRRPDIAVRCAVVSATIALAVLMLADLFRRTFVVHQGAPQRAVLALWGIGAITALLFSAVGALLGRRLRLPTVREMALTESGSGDV
jgi:hypothetical protein